MVKTSTSERSLHSPRSWPADAFVWWRSLLVAVVLCITLYVPVVALALILLSNGLLTRRDLSPGAPFGWPVFWLQMFGYVLPTIVLLAVLPVLSRVSLGELGLRRPRTTDVAWGLAGAIAMVLAVSGTGAIEQAIFHIKADETQVQWLQTARGPLLVALVFLACVAAPLFEEVMFRGFIFNALLRYTPLWVAAIVSAAAFGLAHGIGQPGNNGALAPLAAGGLVLALVYAYSRSLIASMVTHALFNTFTVVVVLALHAP